MKIGESRSLNASAVQKELERQVSDNFFEEEEDSRLEKRLRMQGTVSLLELKKPFEFKALKITNVKLEVNEENKSSASLFIEAGLYHSGELLSPLVYTQTVPVNENPIWNEWLRFDTLLCDLPQVQRILPLLLFVATVKC